MSSFVNRLFRQNTMTRISQLNSGNGGLIFTPALGQHSATVIFMHGLGKEFYFLFFYLVSSWLLVFRNVFLSPTL
jgi:hypothetical protein